MPKISGFLPSTSGFHFANSFDHVPLLYIDVVGQKIPIGDASNGLCGGMAFATRDYFDAHMPIPSDRKAPSSGPLFDYLVKRLIDSFNLFFLPPGPEIYYALMNPTLPDHETDLSKIGFAPHGRAWIMINNEWPKIKADLDSGHLSPIGLVETKSLDPFQLGMNHQVLAYGYDLVGTDLTIYVYDPNHPNDDNVTMSLSIAKPNNTTDVTYSDGSTVWCFFRPIYLFANPPIILPVTELANFTAPTEISWIVNAIPNVAWLLLSDFIGSGVTVMLSSDDPGTITVPASVNITFSGTVMLTVPPQPAAFTSKVVNLTASYAGKQITTAITVVRPEDLQVAPLEIVLSANEDPCAQHFVEGTSQDFVVKNSNVIVDHTGLTYHWTVTGATPSITHQPTLTISSLPLAGTKVMIKVSLKNSLGIHAEGTLEFSTVQLQTGLPEELRRLNCLLQQLKTINAQIPPWVPIEEGKIILDLEQISSRIENQSKRVVTLTETMRSNERTR
jgi:hypothetical protein